MSLRPESDRVESLFSFELLVDRVRVGKESKVSDELAVGVRLLDFPTLLIYQPQQSNDGVNRQPEHRMKERQGEYAFNRGKSCFFKMNLSSLHTQLLNSPLYAMVLDVKEEIPKLVGTALISLAKVMDRIRQDVTVRGASAPSAHGEKGLVGLCDLMGERIGSISLSYKLLSLGESLLPHITDGSKGRAGHGEQEGVMERNTSTELQPLQCEDVRLPTVDERVSRNIELSHEDRRDGSACVAMQAEHQPRRQKTPEDPENCFEEDLTIFCPPRLFYSHCAKEESKIEGEDCKSLNLDMEAFTFEDTHSEEETTDIKIQGANSPKMSQRVRHDLQTSSFGEALQQLPLLNALLVELSQLNHHDPHRPLTVHPNLAWIYRPASADPPAGRGSAARKAQSRSLQKARQSASPHLKRLHSPRNCSTPVSRPASVNVKGQQEQALAESKSSCASPRKKLVYGTTKTFNLRLKQISPLRVKRRECVELIQNETRASMAKGKTKSCNKIMKSRQRESVLNSSLDENVDTMIQSIGFDSALQETVTLKYNNLHGRVHDKQDRYSPGISDKPSLSDRGSNLIRIPGEDGDSVAENKDKSEHHSASNQSQSDRRGNKSESSESSTCSSSKSSFSDSSGEENKEADYADDFNSLEPSDACSPDPMSSPEPSRAKTPRSPVRPDLCNCDSEGLQGRAVLPVPVRAPSSPQRSLRGTHIIRPRTHTSALSFSSDEGDRAGSAFLQAVCSRKQMAESGRVGRSSGADSFTSSRGQSSESKKSSPVQVFSAESVSSLGPLEAEEEEDELGSLDFRKEYQHISKLVANKLPGYTM